MTNVDLADEMNGFSKQEQDTLNGGFDATQAADIVVDTVAVYRAYWTSGKVR